jgi:hypothetical protein
VAQASESAAPRTDVGPATAALPLPTADDAAAWGGIFTDETPREQPAPLLPATPLERPPGTQTRTVLILVGIFVVIMLALAKCGLSGLGDNAFVDKPTSSSKPSATTSATPTTPATTSPSETETGGAPVSIQSVTSFDPQGDGEEKQSLADKAVDGDPGTDWRSDAYKTATFSGLKDGVGLRLDLGSDTAVHEVKVTVPLAGTNLELRAMSGDAGDLGGSTVIASADDADGTVTLTPDKAVTTRYLLLWFTKAVQDKDGYRVAVSEVSVR